MQMAVVAELVFESYTNKLNVIRSIIGRSRDDPRFGIARSAGFEKGRV